MLYKITEFDNAVLVKDHHHLKTKVWPEYLGGSKYAEVKRHLDGVLNCRTREEFEQHRSNVYKSLCDRPKMWSTFVNILIIPNQLHDIRS